MKIFAAIDIGSYEVEMKVFELTRAKGIREIDCICQRLELGKDAYADGKISVEKVEQLCEMLNFFVATMKGYRVDDYRVYATSAIREITNRTILLDYIERRTGLHVEVLGNSAQRFMDYKSIASNETKFSDIIQKGTAIVDIGGGSVQISLFDKDSLVMTQNIRIGNLRLRERFMNVELGWKHYEELLREIILNELESFKKLYMKDRTIQNLIVVADHLEDLFQKNSITAAEFYQTYEELIYLPDEVIAERYEMPEEVVSVMRPTLVIYHCFLEEVEADNIWMPGLHLTDGMAYEYGQEQKILKAGHDFDEDIIAAARVMAKRYQCSKSHIRFLEEVALGIFDKTKKQHGLGKRERLLLQIAVILHGCGKYISMTDVSQCSYNIIMSMEIIGLSKEEKGMIANIVKYNNVPYPYFENMTKGSLFLTMENYLVITKLTAILRLANSQDRSHKQKLQNIRITLKDRELTISVETNEDITLERTAFEEKGEFFEEVFSIHPILRQKKVL